MGRIICALVAFCLALSGPARADDAPVVVELYTSQGCSSCPPADRLMNELAAREDVIALALHVDYWDYIGWKDSFAKPEFTKRQKGYAHVAGSRSIYTPQMIVGGRDHVIGVRPMQLADLIQAQREQGNRVTLQIVRQAGKLIVTARAEPPLTRGAVLQLVRYLPRQTVDIQRGENAGRTIVYSNIVTDWVPVAQWDGQQPFSQTFTVADDAPMVAIMQEPGPGPILAAARVK